jgi:hypothetical protein
VRFFSIVCLLVFFSYPAFSETTEKPVTVAPAVQSQAKAGPPPTACVAECLAFERRCKSPKNTANSLKRDKQAGHPFGALGTLGILLGKNQACTRMAKECSDGCAKTGKAMVTIGNKNSHVPHFDIPASKASR